MKCRLSAAVGKVLWRSRFSQSSQTKILAVQGIGLLFMSIQKLEVANQLESRQGHMLR